MSKKPLIIGVGGGSGSGKTTVVKHILSGIGRDNIQLIQHDSYYRDLSYLPLEERKKQNFDHPSSLETELMIRHVEALKSGCQVKIPVYDFAPHKRSGNSEKITLSEIILLDGILIYTERELQSR